ncbi:MAG: hypothetical protein AAGH99_02355 [Planctomycetota bacterium]
MKTFRLLIKKTRQTLGTLHCDERGAEGLEKLLIVAAIVLPLLGLLLFFRSDLEGFVTERWENVVGTEEANPIPGTSP